MPEISRATKQNLRASMFLKRDLEQSRRVERNLEAKSLRIKKKLVEDRDRTLRALLKSNREKEKQGGASGLLGALFGGGIGGALLRNKGKPGGGGGFFSRLRKPKVPNTPGELLRMQRGNRNVSRLSRFGRFRSLGRISKGNVITNTLFAGVEFAGRKSSGQTNLQAGLGTAGSVTGGILGAAIGQTLIPIPVVGALIGGFIGSSIGGGAADFITGANRRRKFEEQRVLVSAQKSLFSTSLDDFDRVLNKFELVVPLLKLDDDEDEVEPVRRRTFAEILKDLIDRRPPPSNDTKEPIKIDEEKKFLERPVVQITGAVALTALLLTAAYFSRGKSVPASQKILQQIITKSPVLKTLSEKERIVAIGKLLERTLSKSELQKIRMSTAKSLNKRGTIVPGQKGAPGKITKKTNIVKNRRLAKEEALKLKEAGREFRQLQEIKSTSQLIREFIRTGELPGTATPADIKRGANLVFDLIKEFEKGGMIDANQLKALRTLNRLLKRKLFRLENPQFDKNLKNFKKDVPKFKRRDFQDLDDLFEIFEETPLPLGSAPKDLRIDPMDTSGSSNIASANIGNTNIIMLGSNDNKNNNISVFNTGQEIVFGGRGVSSFDAMTKYAENMALMTT